MTPVATLTETVIIPHSRRAVERAPRSGIHAALWIPTDETGALKRESLTRHLNWLKKKGIHGVLALGSTGEFARMDLRQREDILASVIELANPLPVIANISSIRLDETIALGQMAQRLGAVGVAVMPPCFFPLSQEDILEFFLRTAVAVDLPFYLYNYPEVTGNRIGLEVIASFADQARMVGIKQSGAELAYHRDLIGLGREKHFSVFTAADPKLEEFLKLGADGCLGGLANFVPEYMVEVYEACRAGKYGSIQEVSRRLARIGEILSPLSLPLNVRSGMEARGFDVGCFKSPVSGKTNGLYREVVASFENQFQAWGLEMVRAVTNTHKKN